MLHSHTFETANVYKSQSHFSFRFRLKIDQYFQFISNFEMFDVKTKYEKNNSTELPSFVCPVIYNLTFFLVVHPIFSIEWEKAKICCWTVDIYRPLK